MSSPEASGTVLHHALRRMTGRDPGEAHRASTPLELLYDLTFVVAFALTATQFALKIAEGHLVEALLGFTVAAWAICWAWVQFSWFASAYDTDDWGMRIAVLVQMVGVMVLAMGTPRLFATIGAEHIDNRMMVAGYVIMRLPLVALWLRAARSDPERRPLCRASAAVVTVAQIGWVIVAIADIPRVPLLVILLVGLGIELLGPALVQRRYGDIPWHPHHLAERFSLLVIICLGEGITASMSSMAALVGEGWSLDTAALVAAGVGLTFGMWWVYFTMPAGELLAARRGRVRAFMYLHIPVFAAIVATGAGLEVAVEVLEHKSTLSPVAVTAAVAIPVGVYIAGVYVVFQTVAGGWDRFHSLLLTLTLLVLVGAVLLAAAGVDGALALLVVVLAPAVTVVGFELRGHRHVAELIEADAHTV